MKFYISKQNIVHEGHAYLGKAVLPLLLLAHSSYEFWWISVASSSSESVDFEAGWEENKNLLFCDTEPTVLT